MIMLVFCLLLVAAAISLDEYNVDIVEAIGHTDELRIARKESNFDQTVLPLSAGQPIIPGDRLTSAEAGDMRERRRIEIRIHQRDTPDAP